MFEQYPDIVTVCELQKMLRIGRNKAYDLLKQGLIVAPKHGKEYIIPKANVINFVLSIRK
ncbi:helix-turn-helix domain-containing protein [Christensenellaceae bacterium OttesenSCG-928-K19]|nr:helix-turn-helix domain-containing protein [Christensenellaceae bacterium OttesenSCG-928-K19]